MAAMHRCVHYKSVGFRSYEEEYSWSIALYIEVSTSNTVNDVIVCQHPSFTAIQDLKQFATSISGARGDAFDITKNIASLLDNVFPNWRKDFEVVIRGSTISFTVYL